MNINDIKLSEITDQYIEYINKNGRDEFKCLNFSYAPTLTYLKLPLVIKRGRNFGREILKKNTVIRNIKKLQTLKLRV